MVAGEARLVKNIQGECAVPQRSPPVGPRFCDPARKEDESGPLTTGEELGPSYTTTRWLPRKIDRVARKVPTIGHATLEVNLPNDGRLDVYARAAATSDDLPDDVLERVKNFVVRIRRPGDQA